MATSVQDPAERTVLFVSPPELNQTTVVVTHEGPSHIKMPPPIQKKAINATTKPLEDQRNTRADQRCYRCGWARVGPHHKKRASVNTLEYCIRPESDRYPNWKVPNGYAINDNPTARIRTRNMKRQWHQIMEEHGMEDDPRFPDWNPRRWTRVNIRRRVMPCNSLESSEARIIIKLCPIVLRKDACWALYQVTDIENNPWCQDPLMQMIPFRRS